MEAQNEECCPKFETEKWDKKTFSWNNKLFIKETLPTFLHIPFPPMIGKRITKMDALARRADATSPDPKEALILFRDPSAFKSEIYYSVTKAVGGATNTTLSGTYEAMVFDGGYNNIPQHIQEMEKYLGGKQEKATDYLVHYAYCPKCTKKYGHNYMILFAHVGA